MAPGDLAGAAEEQRAAQMEHLDARRQLRGRRSRSAAARCRRGRTSATWRRVPVPDTSAMRCMNSMHASTTPTAIATLRSTSTVSTSVTIRINRSSNGARGRKCDDLREIDQAPGDIDQHGGEARQRQMKGERRQQQHEQQHEHGMQHARDRRLAAGRDVGRGARDDPRCRQPAEQRRGDVGDALAEHLDVRAVAATGLGIGGDRREQRLDPDQERDGEGRGQHLGDFRPREVRQIPAPAARWACRRTASRWSRREDQAPRPRPTRRPQQTAVPARPASRPSTR